MNNINTAEYWNTIWAREGSNTWRVYPETNKQICEIIGSHKEVLELGCGVGILAKRLIDQNNFVFGIDISSKAIELLNDQGIQGIACAVPPIPMVINSKGGGVFNFVVATEFLEHFEDTAEILKEMARVAHKAIIVVPNNMLGNEDCAEHYQKFTIQSLNEKLSKYWKNVLIYEFIDEFESGNVKIRLSNLLALCAEGKHE